MAQFTGLIVGMVDDQSIFVYGINKMPNPSNNCKNKITAYMRVNIEDHVDPLTGEVNDTSLAEDACWSLEPTLEDTPEIYFELAHIVAIEYERKTLPR